MTNPHNHEHQMTVEELLDANARCHQFAGKPLEDCTRDDLHRVLAGLALERKFFQMIRDQAAHDIEKILDRARRRRAGREGA